MRVLLIRPPARHTVESEVPEAVDAVPIVRREGLVEGAVEDVPERRQMHPWLQDTMN